MNRSQDCPSPKAALVAITKANMTANCSVSPCLGRQFLRGFCLATILAGMGFESANAQQPNFDAGSQGQFSFQVRDGLALTAELRLPSTVAPNGIVVILHGGGGVGELERADERDLLAQGLATVTVDSFGGRNFRPAATTGAGTAVRPMERAADAFAVLRALSLHPDLKGKRAVLFGRSHGGSATMVAATSWAKQAYAAGGPGYVGFIALYPGCNASYPEQLSASAPLRMHVGEADDLTPASPCAITAERMRTAGVDVTLTSYPGAHRAFDLQEDARYFPEWVTVGKCNLSLPSVSAPLPMNEISKCATRGATMGRSDRATERFRKKRGQEIAQLLE